MQVQVKRVTDPATPEDGVRVLVDRYWPRGHSVGYVQVDLWARDLAPRPELVAWFAHKPERWDEFKGRYHAQVLHGDTLPLARSLGATAHRSTLTLVYRSRDRNRNAAVALAELLQSPAIAPDFSAPISSRTADVSDSPVPYREFAFLNGLLTWGWLCLALLSPVLILTWGWLVLALGGRMLLVSVLLFGLFVAVTARQEARRDRRVLQDVPGTDWAAYHDPEHPLAGLRNLGVHTLGTVAGLGALWLLLQASLRLAQAL